MQSNPLFGQSKLLPRDMSKAVFSINIATNGLHFWTKPEVEWPADCLLLSEHPLMLYEHCENVLSLLCKPLDFGGVTLVGRCLAVCCPYGHAILRQRMCAVLSPQLSRSLGCKSRQAGRGSGKDLSVSVPSLHLLLWKRKIISAS